VKKVIKLSMMTMTLTMIVACATTSDVENLQAQVNALDASVKKLSADAGIVQTTAADAAVKAEAAEEAADRAAKSCKNANRKLKKKHKRSMLN
jgi:murein lipoprotein